MTGRPTSLTPAVQETILSAIRAGNYRVTACAAAGITRQTLHNWETWGEEGRAPYADFFDALQKAEAEAEMALLAEIREGTDVWQSRAWVMERRWPKRWASRVRTAVTEELDAYAERLSKKLDEATMRKVLDAAREDGGGESPTPKH